jgi:hypothetical protein
LRESATHWIFVPFLAAVPNTAVRGRSRAECSAFECDGPLVPLDQFNVVEFFVSPPDFSWTFVRTHEDFAYDAPYFVRAECVGEVGA